jgi:hypothetical protein
MHGLKKLSAAQRKLKTENLTKNGMLNPLAYMYVEIGVIPFFGALSKNNHDVYQNIQNGHSCMKKH